jgi:hypothetical protein
MKRLPVLSFLLALLLLIAATPRSSLTSTAPDPSMPVQTVKLIFIHHSTGQNWLENGNGDLGLALSQNNYFVSDTNYFYHRLKDSLITLPTISGCSVFPANNIWNTRVDNLPLNARSDQWVNTIGRNTGFHMDFGSGTWDGGPIGIPYNLAGAGTPRYALDFYYPDESDSGPYPIPDDPKIEWGSDHHILVVDTSTCFLYEIYDASYSGGAWHGGSGAIWDLDSNALRPAGWTSADAAGLPMLPGLVRYDEIASGVINHAIRFTASQTNGYIWPARHLTSDDPNTPQIPPYGARFRLKASFDISSYPAELQVILRAMKTYGIILADEGADWYISGAPDQRWDNDMLHLLDNLTGDDFEAVDSSGLMVDPDSGATNFGQATFADVSPDYWAWTWIERLYNAGITGGCGTSPLIYCPEDSVTRAQMAIFLERGMNGSAYTPPAGSGMVFADVPLSNWAVNWIEKLYADGITTGCLTSPLSYCPDDSVTRAQMAIFLLRARHSAAYIPPAVGSSTGFNDVPVTHWAAAWIKQLAAEGITTGCGSGNYCPDDTVSRAQMAKFLVLTFNLP